MRQQYVKGILRTREASGRLQPIDLPDRFWPKVKKTKNCWIWTGTKNARGYGVIWTGGRMALAHRVIHDLLKIEINNGLEFDHLCRNPSCVNPAHLEAVTHQENMRRGHFFNSTKSLCPHGHPYSGNNLVINSNGSRECLVCKRARARAYAKRQRMK